MKNTITATKNTKSIVLVMTSTFANLNHSVINKILMLVNDKCVLHFIILDISAQNYTNKISSTNIHIIPIPHSGDNIFLKEHLYAIAKQVKSIKRLIRANNSIGFQRYGAIINNLSPIPFEKRYSRIDCLNEIPDEHDRIMKRIILKSKRIICNSEDMKCLFDKYYPIAKTSVVYPPIDIANIIDKSCEPLHNSFVPLHDNQGESLTYVVAHVFKEDTNLFWHLFKPFRIIKKILPSVRLLILGDVNCDGYQQLIDALGLHDTVFILDSTKVNPYMYMNLASLNVVTDVSTTFPVSIIEAFTLGIPTLSTNSPNGHAELLSPGHTTYDTGSALFELMGEAIKSCGQYGDPEHTICIPVEFGVITPALNVAFDLANIDSFPAEELNLAFTIIGLLNNKQLLSKYGSSGLSISNNYSVDAFVNSLFDIIK